MGLEETHLTSHFPLQCSLIDDVWVEWGYESVPYNFDQLQCAEHGAGRLKLERYHQPVSDVGLGRPGKQSDTDKQLRARDYLAAIERCLHQLDSVQSFGSQATLRWPR